MVLRSIIRSFSQQAFNHRLVTYEPLEALSLLKAYAIAPYDESVDIALKLNVDPKRGDQLIRGTCSLPKGLGKQTKLAVFTSNEYAEECLKAGADMAGEYLIDEVKQGKLNFDKVLATTEVQSLLKPLGKTLGPRGLMPTVKLGNMVDRTEIILAIKKAKLGSVTFRIEKSGVLHSPLGRVSFSDEDILSNLRAFMDYVVSLRPASVKGKYILQAHISSTQGPAWKLDIPMIDPSSKTCTI